MSLLQNLLSEDEWAKDGSKASPENAADLAKAEFLANISHEIRTPMNVILGLTNILDSEELPRKQQKEFLSTLRNNAEHMMDLINNLLDVTSIDSGSVVLQRIPFNLKDLMNDIRASLEAQAEERGITLDLRFEQSFRGKLIGDPVRLRQALINVIGNAVKFTEKGWVTVDVASRAEPGASEADVKVSVRDTGVGIDPAVIGTIFKKFTQADSSFTRKFGGTGLGLAISRGLIEQMGGSIDVSSSQGIGSTFTIRLSLPFEKEPLLPILRRSGATLKNANILVVEDYQANIMVLTTMLDRFGCKYRVAQNGGDALHLLKVQDFDVVLMDVQMPVMDGLQVTRVIRNDEKSKAAAHIPIIGITAHAMAGDREQCLCAGMDEYIAKPFKVDELETKLAKFVGATRQ